MQHSDRLPRDILAGLVPASLTEYTMVNDRVARVIVSTMSNANTNQVREVLEKAFNGAATPIRGSFRWLNQTRSAMIGYITASTPQVLLDTDKPDDSKFRVVAGNMYMDKADESVWELKNASAGSYMVRHGHDNLSELLETNRVPVRGSVPRMASVIAASAAPNQFLAFVNSTGMAMPAVDHGFVVERNGDISRVVTANALLNVRDCEIVASYSLDPKAIESRIVAGARGRREVVASKSDMVSYYKKLYSYAPDYLKLVLKEIDEMSAM